MKVLFAINNEQISTAIINKYKQLYKEDLEVKSVYYFKALIEEVKANKSYDRVLLFEDLEPFSNNNIETIDQYLFDKIDSVTDEVNNSDIIFVCQERRTANDKLLKRFFSLGIYSILVGKDRNIDAICKMIYRPQTKKDAKKYINYGVEDIYSRDNNVDEVELQRIIAHFKRLGDQKEKYVESFNKVSEQYNNMQMKIICNFLPEQVRKYLSRYSDKYKMYMKMKDELKVKVEFEDQDLDLSNLKLIDDSETETDNKKVMAVGKMNGTRESINKNIDGQNVKVVYDEKTGKEIHIIEKEIIKEITKEVPVVMEQEKEIVKQVFEVPKDYSKEVLFIGGSKVGTTFLINAIAYMLSKNNIKTAILDMTRERNMYYIYTKNNEFLRQKAEFCIPRVLETGSTKEGIEINKNLSLFTSVPGTDRKSYGHMKLLQILKSEFKVVLIDADFTTPLDYYKMSKDIFVVQDMDILTVQQITTFLRELKAKDVSLDKIQVVINKYIKSNVSGKKLMEGLAYYYNPQMTFVDELFNVKKEFFTVPFNEENYAKYINNLYTCDMDFSNFSPDFLEMISVLCSVIYPVNDGNLGKYKSKKFSLFHK